MAPFCLLGLCALSVMGVSSAVPYGHYQGGQYADELLNLMEKRNSLDDECLKAAIDLVFVVDSSNSICPVGTTNGICHNWELVRNFIRDIARKLSIDNGKTRIGMVLFGFEGHVEWTLDKYTTSDELEAAINDLRYLNEWTNIASGVKIAREQVFNQPGDRYGAANVIVILTDGQPNRDRELTLPECRKTERQKVQMFSVGITKEVDEKTLMMLSSAPHVKNEDYFMTPDFQGLDKIMRSVINSTCYKPTAPPATPAPATTPGNKCNEDVDLMFVVDSSNSICPEGVRNGICPNWLLLRKFLVDVIYMLAVNSGRARIGVVMFGYEGQLVWHLDKYTTTSGLEEAINSLEYLNQWTNIADGIRKMRQMGFAPGMARSNAMKVGIVITDGNPNVETEETEPEVMAAIAEDIHMYAVGITRDIHESTLKSLSSPPREKGKQYFMTPDFPGLKNILSELVGSACHLTTPEPTPPIECRDVMVDLVFVVDGSNSICPGGINKDKVCDNWVLMRGFLEDLVHMMPLANGHARIGLVLFGHEGHVQFELDQYSTRSEIVNAIREVPYLNEWTNIGDGVRKMRKEIFTRRGDRPNADNVAIIITDGQPNVQVEQTEPQADMARREGVKMFSVGITEDVSESTLKILSSEPKMKDENYFMAPDFQGLENIMKKVVLSTCENVDS